MPEVYGVIGENRYFYGKFFTENDIAGSAADKMVSVKMPAGFYQSAKEHILQSHKPAN